MSHEESYGGIKVYSASEPGLYIIVFNMLKPLDCNKQNNIQIIEAAKIRDFYKISANSLISITKTKMKLITM